jgi:hypothetical protein
MTHEQAVATLATERYLLDEMSGVDRDAFEEHFFSCDICADDVRVAAAMVRGTQAGFATAAARGSAPKPPIKGPWYRSVTIAWVAAAALLVISTYQTLLILRPNASTVAIVPVTLRPASRGAEAVVPLPSGGGPVSLAVEINEPAAGREIAYQLDAAGGGTIASGRAVAPAAGMPLFLLIPSSALAAPGHYTLSIHDPSASNRVLGEYRFAVSRE